MRIVRWLSQHHFIQRYPTAKQLVKFLMVGGTVTLIDFTIYIALTRFVGWFAEHYLTANAIAFFIALCINFFANKFWTFRERISHYGPQALKFGIANLLALAITQSTLYVFVSIAGVIDIIAKPLSIVLVACWNFIIYKYWVFPVRSVVENRPEEDAKTA